MIGNGRDVGTMVWRGSVEFSSNQPNVSESRGILWLRSVLDVGVLSKTHENYTQRASNPRGSTES